jgi:hypothetical protein
MACFIAKAGASRGLQASPTFPAHVSDLLNDFGEQDKNYELQEDEANGPSSRMIAGPITPTWRVCLLAKSPGVDARRR